MRRVHEIGRACRTYAEHHDGQWPEDLRALIPTYIRDEDGLKNPRLPERDLGFVYHRPEGLKPTSPEGQQTVVLYEAYDVWPESGIVVLYADGRSSRCPDEAELKKRLAATEPEEEETP